jgi:hypothetical protein
MNLSTFRQWIFVVAILLMIGISGCAGSSQNSPTETLLPSSTPTLVPPSETPVPFTATFTAPPPTDTPTATLTPTPTLPPSDTPTPTEEPVSVELYAYTVCRYGPGTAFEIHTYFEEDGTAWVRGRLEDDSWYLIELPESGETCWIFNSVVTLQQSVAMMPILTPPPIPTPAPRPTQSEEEKALGVKYFLIIPDNGGPFACGDGLAYFYSGKKGNGIEDDITVALNALFAVDSEYVGSYYNPLFRSSLKVKDVKVNSGHATIWLGGNFVKPKSECEAQRIHLQVWETASQFAEITNRPVIWVNNVLLGDLLEAIQK